MALKESFKIDLRASLPIVHEKSEKEQVIQNHVAAPPPQRYSRGAQRHRETEGEREERGESDEGHRRNRNRQVGFELIRTMEARRPIPFLVFMLSKGNSTVSPG
ncbi:hypothetical protein GUITHDRAFT_156533 [Guillardia theta CCMP2712]|uniref:Uncharacterized protein n=2 Tax=Guillardia theta TaxID=55529 RepID=L1I5S0_GUITC|nr:hypothetical protein GUITHDRAFT_156533 [Guillardia theta CCMP2712]EKX31608.1 hypothetical protein GUITHDRAFT_156533 [Guillardia theta CCMP2712]|eukprot:XP_005818588.1 hypothetical protein GUITHDRAFT_156533 [Guillardia theta CCMP2712]